MASSVLVPSSLKTHNDVSTRAASVAYTRLGSHLWMIPLGQGGSATYTWRKAAASSSSFVDQRSFGDSPKATTPALGSRQSGSSRWGLTFVGKEGYRPSRRAMASTASSADAREVSMVASASA